MLNNVELYYYLATRMLSNQEHNALMQIIKDTDNEHVLRTHPDDIKSELDAFLAGEYIITRKPKKELKNEEIEL